MSLTLIPLTCPACSASLNSGPERRVFVCACGVSSTPETVTDEFAPQRAPRLKAIERCIAWPSRELPPEGRIVLVPSWIVPVHSEITGTWSEALPPEVRIPAVGVRRMELLLRCARNLTRAAGGWQALSGVDAEHPAAELTVEDAFAVAEPVALGRVEGWPPDPEADDIEIPMGSPRLVDLPCHWSGSQVVDLTWGISIPPPLVDPDSLPDHRSLFVALAAAMD